MKKLIIIIIGILAFIPFVGKANTDLSKYKYTDLYDTIVKKGGSPKEQMPVSDDNVNVYMIWGDGCPHCTEFIKFMEEYYKEFPHINLYAFEVWNESANKNLINEVEKEYNIRIGGVPFIVIGDKYFSGYGESRANQVKQYIQTEYNKTKDKRINRIYVNDKKTKTTVTTTTTAVTTSETITNSSNTFKDNSEKTEEKKTEEKKTENNENETVKYILYVAIGITALIVIILIIKGIK
jgi:thiol-disulfide isomerase/thioredoxin